MCDKIIFAAGATSSGCLDQIGLGLGIRGLQQIFLPVFDCFVEKTTAGKNGVGNPVHMTLRARPRVIPRGGDQAGAYGVQFHIPHRRIQVTFIQGAGIIPPLPEMPDRLGFTVEILRVQHMDRSEDRRQRVIGMGNANDVDMVRHEAVGPDIKLVPPGVLAEQFQVAGVIIGLTEDRLAVIRVS